MSYRSVLTDEELEYLHNLLHASPDLPSQDARFTLTGSVKGTALLRDLAASNCLSLEARRAGVHIRFALRFEEDSLGHLHLHLKTPRLTELEPKPRSWRAKLSPALPLLSHDHQPLHWELLNFSATGAVIEFHQPAPKYCEFVLPLPTSQLNLRARRVRYISLTSAAYRIFTANAHELEQLCAYLYYLHQRAQRLP